jgi:hypothetical protein
LFIAIPEDILGPWLTKPTAQQVLEMVATATEFAVPANRWVEEHAVTLDALANEAATAP